MARGLFRKVSFAKTVGAYRSLWKRTLLRFFFPGYGMKGAGWLRDPKKAWYNWLYHRTSISIPRLLGYKPSFGATMAALFVASLFNLVSLPADTVKAASKSGKIKKAAKERGSNFGKIREFTDDEFHEPRVKKTESTKEVKPKVSPTPKTENPKPKKSTLSVSRSASTPRPKNEIKAETSSKSTSTSPKYTPSPVTSTQRIPTSEIVANTYISDPTKPTATAQHITDTVLEIDENTPKSKPKNENDQYIKKRMVLESPNAAVLSSIKAGSYIDVSKDETSGKVILTFDGQTAGFVSESDSMPLQICLRLGRKMYAAITDMTDEKCEFEIWFEGR